MANLNPAPTLYFIFYNLLYGLVFSFLVPLYCLRKEKATLASAGGQLIPKMAMGEQIPWHLLPLGILSLIMTTFFEEFLFRGFVQSRAAIWLCARNFDFWSDVLPISSGLSRFSYLEGFASAVCGGYWICCCIQDF